MNESFLSISTGNLTQNIICILDLIIIKSIHERKPSS